MIRVFLVDDHTLVRSGIRAVLSDEPSLEVVGEASNGQELLDQLADTPADVVLLDMNMPILNGVETAARLHEDFPDVRVLVLSMLGDEHNIGRALDAGAHGYVLKNADKGEIVVAIQAVAAGKHFLCSDLGMAMLRKVLASEPTSSDPTSPQANGLSFREREVLQLIASGMTNQEISDKLFTSKRTVETHRQNILEKTQSKNTAALIKYAMQNGMIKEA